MPNYNKYACTLASNYGTAYAPYVIAHDEQAARKLLRCYDCEITGDGLASEFARCDALNQCKGPMDLGEV